MSNIKYTTDGRKVVVIGQLNAKETIVQEIFVTESNQEIPSGENFVIKSLHDEPVKSWKARDLEREEKSYRDRVKELDELRRKIKVQQNFLDDKLKHFRHLNKNLQNESFDLFVKFILGKVKFVVKYNDWSDLELLPFNEFTSHYDGLRLFTVFGRDTGNLDYMRNSYKDESGSSVKFQPFEKKEDAMKFLVQKWQEKTQYRDGDFQTAEKYNLKIDPKLKNDFKEKKTKEYKGMVDRYKKEVNNYKEKIKTINKL